MYAIVEFTLTKEVEAVPISWVSGNQCQWAPVVDRFTFEKYVKRGKSPQSNWDTFEIRILYLAGKCSFVLIFIILYNLLGSVHVQHGIWSLWFHSL